MILTSLFYGLQLEEFEGKRITEENRIFNEETKLAGEFKAQTGKLNAQINRLDSAYRKKISQLMKSKNSIQVFEHQYLLKKTFCLIAKLNERVFNYCNQNTRQSKFII